ncbi:hypothetical protein [Spiroplasma chrysopicola]|uniref:Transmembrane protein n=1 Tax=Spiroplasma chrysopicola DF-1 TaxID=1276227 RepID=R4UGA8_9MOLU|nr:hypothetical protein [Spiroplasma chrysopicola]AGM25135.1 hypothetical protein SCHRY_v1c05570 [Spiroplasma chrysopicola DF-1]
MAKSKNGWTFTINITFQKIMVWIAGLWLFIMAILNSFGVDGANIQLYGNDRGSIILISSFLYLFVTTFVRHKWSKLIVGILFLVFAVIGIIGALITSVSQISTWLIFVAELVTIIGALIWLLEGLGVIKIRTKNAATPAA